MDTAGIQSGHFTTERYFELGDCGILAPDDRVELLDGPLRYQDLRSGIRRALLRRFPYAAYFAIDQPVVVVVAVLRASRDPAEWQRQRG
jgi:hypothetical protein